MCKPSSLLLVLIALAASASLPCAVVRADAIAYSAKDASGPTPPFVAPVPASADWTITAKYPPPPPDAPPKGDKAPDPRIAEVHTTKTGEIRHDHVVLVDGNESDQWYVSGFLLTMPPGSTEVAVYDLSNDPPPDPRDGNPTLAKGFPGVGWVKFDAYDQTVPYEKHTCYHYLAGEIGSGEAWIDTETKLPVAYKAGDAVYKYRFNEPPTGPLVLPAVYREAMERAQKMIEHRRQLQRDLLGK